MTFIEVKEKENKPIDGHISTDDISLVYVSGNDTIIKTRDGACYTALQSMDSYEIATLSGVIITAETGYKVLTFHSHKGKDDPKPYSEEPVIAWSIAAGYPPIPICLEASVDCNWHILTTILYPNGMVCCRAMEDRFDSIEQWIAAEWEHHDEKLNKSEAVAA